MAIHPEVRQAAQEELARRGVQQGGTSVLAYEGKF